MKFDADMEIALPDIEEAEFLAFEPRKSDHELAREYAEMIDSIYMDAADLDLGSCPPDRRIFKKGREAWVYNHGNVAELVFVK
jgi:hypothetical protein